jgi:hypothetical protein
VSRQSRLCVLKRSKLGPKWVIVTHVNKGNQYPYMSERQRKRYARQSA